MNLSKIGARTISRLVHSKSRPDYNGTPPTGCAFAPLLKGPSSAFSHPLDDEEGYIKFMQEELPIECCESMTDVLGLKTRTMEMLKYNLPGFHTCWTFIPEMFYRIIAPEDHQTAENLRKSKILRACIDMKFSFTAVLDDIVDESDQRMSKPAWKHACPEGVNSAFFDTLHLKNFPYYLIVKHFGDSIKCEKLLKVLIRGDFKEVMGSHLDLISQRLKGGLSRDVALEINRLKTGSYVAMQAPLGMIHAGIMDDELINRVVEIFTVCGVMVQNWDDFTDYYCTSKQTGKPACDLVNAGTTWVTSAAYQQFTPEQKLQFNEAIGSNDPEKIEKVRELCDSVDLTRLYIESVKKNVRYILPLIEELDHAELQRACISWLDWFAGDVFSH